MNYPDSWEANVLASTSGVERLAYDPATDEVVLFTLDPDLIYGEELMRNESAAGIPVRVELIDSLSRYGSLCESRGYKRIYLDT